jgi:hypothetical protein
MITDAFFETTVDITNVNPKRFNDYITGTVVIVQKKKNPD